MYDLIKLIEAYHLSWAVYSKSSTQHPYEAWVNSPRHRHAAKTPFSALFHALHVYLEESVK